MSFSVDPDVLTALGDGLHDAVADRLWYGTNYAKEWINAGSGGQVFEEAFGEVNKFEPVITGGMGKLWVNVMHSAEALVKTADLYRKTDSTTAAQIDETMPVNGSAPYVGADPDIPDLGDFAGFLGTPSANIDFEDYSTMVQDALDGIGGPAEWILEILEQLGMPEPFKLVGDYVVGDWTGLARSGDAIRKLSTFLERVAETLDEVEDSISYSWQGHAAQSAWHYFENLAGVCTDAAENLAGAAQTVQLQAEAIKILAQELSDAVEALFSAVADELLYSFAELNVELPPLALVGLVLAFINAFRIETRIALVIKVAGKIKDSVDRFVVALALMQKQLAAFEQGIKNPGAYSAPDVAGDGSNADPEPQPSNTGPV